MSSKKRISLFILAVILATIACSSITGDGPASGRGEPAAPDLGSPPSVEPPDVSDDTSTAPGTSLTLPGTELDDLLLTGDLELAGILGNSEDGETSGPVLTMTLVNTSDEEITVEIPCGLVFAPTDEGVQPMMVVQPLSLTLAAGESKQAAPFVICVDIAAAAPDTSNSYTIGYLAAGDLLALAECVCAEDLNLDPMATVGVQFAAWSIQIQGDISNLDAQAGSAIEDFMAGEDVEAFEEIFQEMLAMYATQWLDKCGIVIVPAQ